MRPRERGLVSGGPSRRRRVAFGLAVPLLLLAAGEAAVRLADPAPPAALIATPLAHAFDQHGGPEFRHHPRLFWEVLPNLDGPLTGHADRTDALGLRNATAPGPRRPGTVRVLCLGDSCTYGLGVAFEDSWPARLAAEPRLDVINAGVPGYTSYQGLLLFDEKLAGTDPDVVVVEFGINDVAPWPTPDGDEWAYLTDRQRAAHVRFAARPWGSALIGWIAGRVAVPAPERVPVATVLDAHTGVSPRVPPADFEENVRRLAGLAPRAVLVAWTFRARVEGLRRGRPDAARSPVAGVRRMEVYRGILRRVAEEHGHGFVDVERLFIASGLSPTELFVDDVHASPRGAQLVADAVAAALEGR